MNDKTKENIKLLINSVGSNGEGVGKHQGMTIFIDGALPGEEVIARLSQVKKSYAHAELIKIVTPSVHRVKPICPLFGRCGGCQIMHLEYSEQLKVKRQKVIDALTRIGKLENIHVAECIASPTDLNYRNKVQLPVAYSNDKLLVGFYQKKSHTIIPVENCYIHCDVGDKVFEKVKSILSVYKHDIEHEIKHLIIKSAVKSCSSVVIFVRSGRKKTSFSKLAAHLMEECSEISGVVENINPGKTKAITGKRWNVLAGNPYIYEEVCDLTFKISPASFFQVNTYQAELLYRKAIELAGIEKTTRVMDAYCGIGTLSLIAAKHAKQIIGIECVPQAIEDAKENARRNDINNCEFLCGRTEEYIEKFSDVDLVIINPPRQGCDTKVISALCNSISKKIIYISCDPATLARDLSQLVENGYTIEKVIPFDMFPQTMHVETIVLLKKK